MRDVLVEGVGHLVAILGLVHELDPAVLLHELDEVGRRRGEGSVERGERVVGVAAATGCVRPEEGDRLV